MTLILADKAQNDGEQPGMQQKMMFRHEYSALFSSVSVKFVISVVKD